MTKLFRFFCYHWRSSLIAGILLIGVVWFAVLTMIDTRDFRRNPPTDPDLQAWMTPGYVGIAYGLRRPDLAEVFALDQGPRKRETLGEISARLDMSLEALTAEVRVRAAEIREERARRHD